MTGYYPIFPICSSFQPYLLSFKLYILQAKHCILFLYRLDCSGQDCARLAGKIPQALRARMIFPRNPEGPALPSEKRRLPTLPGSSPVCQWLYMPPFPFRTCFHYPCFHKAWNTKRAVREDSPVLQGIAAVYMPYLFHLPIFYAGGIRIPGS